MEWAAPWAFWVLIPVLALPFQRYVTGANRLAIPGLPDRRRWTLGVVFAWLPRLLQVLGLVLLVFALARPRYTEKEILIESDGLDIVLAIDTSGSMEKDDFFTKSRQRRNRLEVAKGVVAEFVVERPYDRIGVVVFGEEAFTQVPLTVDHDSLIGALDMVQIGIAGSRGTAIGSAIAVSARRLKQLESPSKILILLTDGRNNAGRLTPVEAAQAANALGVRIYTVGVGSDGGGGWFGQGEGLDEATLKAVADATGGQYFRAQNTDTLRQIYATIDELETSPAEVREISHHTELFRYPLVPGLILLMLELFLSSTLLRRGP